MTCGEFLQLLIDNPEKELRLRRKYHSGDNGRLNSYGYATIQKLGHLEVIEVADDYVLIEINQFG
jgi:hypothetical protein